MSRCPVRRTVGAALLATAMCTVAATPARGQAPTRADTPADAAAVITAPADAAAVLTAPSSGDLRIEVARVRAHVRALAVDIGPRPTGSTKAQRAAEYIINRLTDMGLTVERTSVGRQRQPRISVGSMLLFRERTITITDDNLLVRFAGADTDAQSILLMAHYDTVPAAPGVIDNGVSVGLLLELARVLSQAPPPRPIILAFTAAEEQRLAGARALASQLRGKVGLAVALDLVGWRKGLVLTGLSDLLGKQWLDWIAGVARTAEVELSAPVLMRLISRLLPQIERSDHGPFTELGVPAFQLYHRGDDRVFRAYHTSRDTMTQIDDGGVEEVARFIHALAGTGGALPKPGGEAGWWTPIPGGPHVFPTAVAVVIELLLFVAAMLGLVSLWRRRPRWRTKHYGLLVVLPAYACVWLSVSGYIALAGYISGHPRPWVHSPTINLVAALLLALGLGVLLGWSLGRARKVAGKARYLAAGIAIPAVMGLALMVADASELAWIVLWVAAALGGVALAHRSWIAWPCFAASLLPLAEPLSPAFLREAVYHGFLTEGMPLGLVLGALLLPHTLAGVYMVRRWLPPLPERGSRALALVAGALLVVSLCTVLLVAKTPLCDGEQFRQWNLACEILRE